MWEEKESSIIEGEVNSKIWRKEGREEQKKERKNKGVIEEGEEIVTQVTSTRPL